jgi:hypothetical protein
MLPIYRIIRTCQMVIYNHKGEIYMLKKVKEILDKRSKINDEDDYRIEKCRDELIDALSQDELLTIDILNQLNEKEILYTSEVFEEIAYNLQSVNYINCLKYIEKKYPSLDIKDAIEVATEFI